MLQTKGSSGVKPAFPKPGSLSAADVTRYERRVDNITTGMEELDVEEIKNQVLYNHIIPLSRPGSAMSDCK